MSTLSIHRSLDPLLQQSTRVVERFDKPVAQLIEAMIHTMRHHSRCVGLAAPQVGSPLRIAVMDASQHLKAKASHGLLVLVNPQLEGGSEVVIQREGCLSVPDFTANVRRTARVRLRALDQHGVEQEWQLEGFEAIVAQHEVDHLNGKLFLDRVTNIKTDVFRRKAY